MSPTEEELTRENYYEYPAVSHSSLGHLDSSMGGSAKRFKNCLLGLYERKDSMSMERGRLMHKYAEDPKTFIVEDENKPSDAICEIVRGIYDEVSENEIPNEDLSKYSNLIMSIARALDYQKGWGEEAIKKAILEKGSAYFKFIVGSTGKYMLSNATKILLEKLKPRIDLHLEEIELGYPSKDFELFNEHPILFEYEGLKMKSLLDKFLISYDRKKVALFDFKSTSVPISKFFGHITYAGLGTVEKRVEPGPFQYYKIYRQLTTYLEAINITYPKITNGDAFVIPIETIDPNESQMFSLPVEWMIQGRKELSELAKEAKTIIDSDPDLHMYK